MSKRVPSISEAFDTIEDWDQVKIMEVALDRLDRWHCPGLLAIGDAAHAMSPQLGQGANMALTDAFYLQQVLQQQFLVPEALMSYSERRKKHLKYYQWASRFLTPLFQSNSWMGATFRDLTFPPMKYISLAKRQALLTLFGVKPSFLGSKPNIDLNELAQNIRKL